MRRFRFPRPRRFTFFPPSHYRCAVGGGLMAPLQHMPDSVRNTIIRKAKWPSNIGYPSRPSRCVPCSIGGANRAARSRWSVNLSYAPRWPRVSHRRISSSMVRPNIIGCRAFESTGLLSVRFLVRPRNFKMLARAEEVRLALRGCESIPQANSIGEPPIPYAIPDSHQTRPSLRAKNWCARKCAWGQCIFTCARIPHVSADL